MAKRKLYMLLNVGLDDQKKHGIPNSPEGDYPPLEGEVISVDEDMADLLVNKLKLAKDYDAKEVKAHEQEVRAADAAVVEPEVANKLAREQAEKDAAKALKGK